MKTIFDASFKYKPSFDTDVRKTFERIRREQHAGKRKWPAAANSDGTVNVLHLEQVKKGT
jgi:hypothetical protein